MKTVTIYSTPACTFCNMAKDYFKKNDIEFTEYNVAEDTDKRTEMVEKSGQMGVPVIFIGDDMVIGFDEGKVESLLKA